MPGGQFDLDYLQWNAPNELSHAGFDVAELTENDLPRSEPVGNPAVCAFYRIQYRIETSVKVCQHMVVIKRRAVISPQGGR